MFGACCVVCCLLSVGAKIRSLAGRTNQGIIPLDEPSSFLASCLGLMRTQLPTLPSVPALGAQLSSTFPGGYDASHCIDGNSSSLCVTNLETRAWLSVRVPAATPVCLVR